MYCTYVLQALAWCSSGNGYTSTYIKKHTAKEKTPKKKKKKKGQKVKVAFSKRFKKKKRLFYNRNDFYCMNNFL